MSNLLQKLVRLSKASLFSFLGTAVDMLVLWLCSDYWLQGYIGEYIISPCISFEFGVVTNFFVAQRFVWQDRVLNSPKIPLWNRFIKYNLSCILAFCVRVGISLLLHWWLSWDVVPCNLIAMLFSGGLNFLLQHFWVFSKKRHNINRMC